MNTKQKFVKLAEDEAKNNSLYLWGGQGEKVLETTPKKLLKMETGEANAARILKCLANKLTTGCNMDKARYFDCSGLIVYILQTLELIKDDYTADGIYRKLCSPIKKTDLKPGDLVFISTGVKVTHVGVYVADNVVVEAVGRDYGIMRRSMSKNGWNVFGRVNAFEK